MRINGLREERGNDGSSSVKRSLGIRWERGSVRN